MIPQETLTQRDALGYEERVTRRNPAVSWRDREGQTHSKTIEEKTVVGTEPQVDLRLADPLVSRLHAELDPRESGLWVRDLGSRNGSYVENVLVLEACVPKGGKVRFGDTELTVTYGPQETPVELWAAPQFGRLIGPSVKMREIFARLARIARSPASVLIEGETGTGKELVARAIHDASPRAGRPFVVIDCGALPENLLDAELFGHVRGAFTGAVDGRAGAIESAEGGTVFLDEVGELPLGVQPKLLRVLESRTVRRLGQNEHRPVDVRVVSATHRDLRTMVNNRAFREDLYFRLAVLPVRIPPLRERPGDIIALAQHFLPPESAGSVTPQLMRELVTRPWLGNVRELRNVLERIVALGSDAELSAAHPRVTPGRTSWHANLTPDLLGLQHRDLREQVLQTAEQEYLRALLEKHGRNISAAAAASGLNRTYLHRLIAKHQL
jgi:two-component system, NtrC family, response regulator GlrR